MIVILNKNELDDKKEARIPSFDRNQTLISMWRSLPHRQFRKRVRQKIRGHLFLRIVNIVSLMDYITQLTITCSNSTKQTLETGVKYV